MENKYLKRYSKIRLFDTYMKSKFSLLIPVIVTSNGTLDTWMKIRRIIFNNILEKATLPLESCGLMKIGYYSIMVRPTLNLYGTLPQLGRAAKGVYNRVY